MYSISQAHLNKMLFLNLDRDQHMQREAWAARRTSTKVCTRKTETDTTPYMTYNFEFVVGCLFDIFSADFFISTDQVVLNDITNIYIIGIS